MKGYKRWLIDLANRRRVESAVAAKFPKIGVSWQHIHLVIVGHRYDPSAMCRSSAAASVLFLRYGYDSDKTVVLQSIPTEGRSEVVGGRAPTLSKDYRLADHQNKSSRAAQEAFGLLRRQLRDDLNLVEKIHGKNRVRYGDAPCVLEVRFNAIGLQCFFNAGEDLDDPQGRCVRSTHKSAWTTTCGIISDADVPYVITLLRSAQSAAPNL